MSYYDSYVEKIRKVAKVKNTVVKYRVPIIITASLIVASVTGFLLSKGTITQNVSLPTEMVYGEDINITEAEALFAETEYEYCLKGTTNWVRNKPRMPGDYLVRVVSIGGFGEEKYGKPVEFTISPKITELTIKDSSVVYGSDPTNIGIDLVYNDRIENIEFIYDDITKDSTNVKIDLDSLVIFSEDDEDVTAFYTLSTEPKLLNISKKSIALTPDIVSKVYDGLEISYSDTLTPNSVESLVNGDTITLKTIIKDNAGNVLTSLPKDAGKYTCDIDVGSIKIVNGTSDRTNKYNISTSKVNFDIAQREINVFTGSATKVYDGQILQKTSVEECGISSTSPYQLVSGDYLVVDESKLISSITNVGKVSNELSVFIYNKDNIDVTSNYKISYTYGSLEVTQLELLFEAHYIASKEYDGEYISYEVAYSNYTSVDKTIPTGEEIKLNISFTSQYGTGVSVKDSGTYSYLLTSFEVNNGLVDNYKVSIAPAQFEITKRAVSLKPFEFNDKVYDGMEVSYPTYVGNYEVVSSWLVDGEAFTVELSYLNSNKEIVKPLDASIYTASIANIIPQTGTSSANYEFTYVPEEFEITKKQLTIKPDISCLDNKANYDGLVHNYNYLQDYNYIEINGERLPNFEKIRISGVSFYYHDGDNLVLADLKNAGTYTVKIDAHSFNELVNSNNYEVTYEEAEVTIYPREVIIAPVNFKNKNYDGTAYTYEVKMGNFGYPSYVSNDNKLVEGENISIEATFNGAVQGNVNQALQVDQYVLSVVADSMVGDSNTLLSNYVFSYDTVSFQIDKRLVTIAPNNNNIYGSAIYDGTIRTYDYKLNNYTLVENSFVEGEDVYISSVGFYVDGMPVEEVKNANVYEVRIIDIQKVGNIDLDNYQIEYRPVNYEIQKRNISISPINFENKDYDGEYYEYQLNSGNFVYNEGSLQLVEGEELIIYPVITGIKYPSNGYSVKDADIYTISINYVSPYNNLDLNNYIIDITSTVSFTISPRSVTLKPIEVDDYIYDGNYYAYPYNEGNFIHASSTKYQLVGQESLIVDTKITDSLGNEVVPHDIGTYTITILGQDLVPLNGMILDNYIFNYEVEIFSILVREVHINLEVLEDKDYDGIYFEYDKLTYTINQTTSPNLSLANGEEMKIHVAFNNAVENVKDVATYTVTLFEYFINDGNINKDNYKIVSDSYDVTIDTRKVTLRPNNFDDKTYDGEYYVYDNETMGNFTYPSGTEEEHELVAGENIRVSVYSVASSLYSDVEYDDIKNADKYTLHIDLTNIVAQEGTLLTNYTFTYEECSFDIYQKDITIAPINFENKDYDGNTYTYKEEFGNFVDVNSSLVKEENFLISIVISSEKGYENLKNADTYTLSVNTEEGMIIPQEGTILANYNFSYETCSFTIAPRKVTLTPVQIKDRIYNGVDEYQYINYSNNTKSNYDYPANTSEDKKIVSGENFSFLIAVNGSTEPVLMKNVGEYVLTIVDDKSTWIPSNENSLVDNYSFKFDEHTFIISPRDVYIAISPDYIIYNESKIYDGSVLDYEKVGNNYAYAVGTPTTYDMVSTEAECLQISSVLFYCKDNVVDYPKDAGTYTIKIDAYVSLDEEILILTNYNIITTYGDGSFTIDPRPITIKPNNFNNKVYNAEAYEYEIDANNFIVTSGSLAEYEYKGVNVKEELYINVYYVGNKLGELHQINGQYPIDADTYSIYIESVFIDETKEYMVLSNYDITYSKEVVEFTISPRTVYITLEEYLTKYYDTKEYSHTGINYDSVTDKNEIQKLFNLDNVLEAYDLVENHYLELTINFNGVAAPVKNADHYVVTLNLFTVYRHVDGEFDLDIRTSNYNIVAKAYEFDIDKLPIGITPIQLLENLEDENLNGKKTYDGNYVTYPLDQFDYVLREGFDEINTLFEGDSITVEVSITGEKYPNIGNSVKDADKYTVRFTSINYSSDLVEQNYDIEYLDEEYYSTFEIERRSVAIVPYTLPTNYVYIREEVRYTDYYPNGNFTYPSGTLDENMFAFDEGVIITVKFSDGTKDLQGEYTNLVDYVINADEYTLVITDVQAYNTTNLDNYILDYEGTSLFTISPREITLVPGGVESRPYNGKAFEFEIEEGNYSVISGSILTQYGEGFTITNVVYSTDSEGKNKIDRAVDAGTYYALVKDDTEETIVPNENTIFTNYKISINLSTKFEITKLNVKIKVNTDFIVSEGDGSDTDTYDGTKFTYNFDAVDSNGRNYLYSNSTKDFLVEGENVEITQVYFTGTQEYAIDAGTYSVTLNKNTIRGLTKYVYDEETQTWVESGITNVDNYNFEYEAVSYTINTRKVKVELYFDSAIGLDKDNSKTYDAKYVSVDSVLYKVTILENYYYLVDGHQLQLTILFDGNLDEVRYAGSYKVSLVEWAVLDGEGNPVTHDNYYIDETDLSIKINPRNITIRPIELDREEEITYSDTKLYYPSGEEGANYFDVIDGELQKDENGNEDQFYITVEFTNTKTQATSDHVIDAGTYDIEVVTIYALGSEKDQLRKSYNFDTAVSKSFTINKKVVYIDLNKIEDGQEYNNVTYFAEEFDYTIPSIVNIDGKEQPNGLISGHSLIINVTFNNDSKLKSIKNVGTYEVNLEQGSWIISKNGKLINSENYDIKAEGYSFSIEKREMTIYPIFNGKTDGDKTYNGYEYQYQTGYTNYYSDQIMAKGESMEVFVIFDGELEFNKNLTSPKNADNYIVSIQEHLIKVSDGVDLETNYDITFIEGSYIINPIKVTLVPGGVKDKIYDGNAFEFEVKEGNYSQNPANAILKEFNEGFTITEVVYSTDPEGKNKIETPIVNKGTYYALVKDDTEKTIVPNENTIFTNYDISINLSTKFVIDPRPIYIRAGMSHVEEGKDGKYYDGEVRKYSSEIGNFAYYKVDNKEYFELAKDEYLTIDVEFQQAGTKVEPKNAGTYYLVVKEEYLTFSSKDGRSHEEIMDNYAISYYNAYDPKEGNSYTIEPRKVTINPLDIYGDKIYDNVIVGVDEKTQYPTDRYGNYTIPSSSLGFVGDDDVCITDILFENLTNTSITTKSYALDAGTYKLVVDKDKDLEYKEGTLKDNYAITFDSSGQTFTIFKRGISIELADIDSTKIIYKKDSYNPYPHQKGEEKVTNKAEYETLLVTVDYYFKGVKSPYPTDAGEYTYKTDLSKISVLRDGEDSSYPASYNYYLLENIEPKTFTIHRAPITIYAIDCGTDPKNPIYYDGKEFDYQSYMNGRYVIDGELYDDETSFKLSVKFKQGDVEVKPINAGTYDIYGFELTGNRMFNYDPTYATENTAKLIITPRIVYVSFEGDTTKIYTGKAYDFSDLSIKQEGIIGNDKLKVTETAYTDSADKPLTGPAVNVGTYYAKIVKYEFETGLSSNYNVQSRNSTIYITPCKATITPYILDTGFDYGEGSNSYAQVYGNYSSIEFEVESESFKDLQFAVAFNFANTSIIDGSGKYKKYEEATEAGKYILEIDQENSLVNKVGELVSNFKLLIDESNYNNTKDKPAFVINTRKVTVYTGDAEFYYDSEPHVYKDGFRIDEESEYALVAGHQFVESVDNPDKATYTFTNVKRDESGKVIPYVNKIPASIVYIEYDENGKIIANTNMSHNYEINYEYGYVTILPIELYVETETYTSVYTGADFKFTKNSYHLLNPEALEIKVTKEKDGVPYTATYEHTLELVGTPTITNVGTYDNIFEFEVYPKTGAAVTNNFEIIQDYGTTTITKASIELSFEPEEQYFKNEAYVYDLAGTITSEDKLAGSKKYTISEYQIMDKNNNPVDEIKYAGEYKLYIKQIKYGNEVIASNDNYDLSYPDYVTFNVKKVDITISSGSKQYAFDGIPHSLIDVSSSTSPQHEALLGTFDIIKPEKGPSVIDPGTSVENKLDIKFTFSEEYPENYMDNNFNITYDWGTLYITNVLNVNIRVQDYDGKKWGTGEDIVFSTNISNVEIRVSNYQLIYSNGQPVNYILDSGNYYFEEGFTYKIYFNGQDYTDDFDFRNPKDLYVSINKLHIIIKPVDQPIYTYDGQPKYMSNEVELVDFTDKDTKETYYSDSLPDGHTVSITFSKFAINAIDNENYFDIEDYVIYDQNGRVVNNNFDVKKSAYDFKSNPSKQELRSLQGFIKIVERRVYVKTFGATMEYMSNDDGYIYNNYYEYIPQYEEGYDLPEGFRMEVRLQSGKPYCKAINEVGKVKNELKFNFYDSEGNNVTKNFAVDHVIHDDMFLEITPKKLYIYTHSAEKEYVVGEDNTLTCKEWTVVGLVQGYEIKGKEEAITGMVDKMGDESTDGVRQVLNTVDLSKVKVQLIGSNGKATFTHNYDIVVIEGTLTMYPLGYDYKS